LLDALLEGFAHADLPLIEPDMHMRGLQITGESPRQHLVRAAVREEDLQPWRHHGSARFQLAGCMLRAGMTFEAGAVDLASHLRIHRQRDSGMRRLGHPHRISRRCVRGDPEPAAGVHCCLLPRYDGSCSIRGEPR